MTGPQAFILGYPHANTMIKFSLGVQTKRVHPEQVHRVEEDKLPNKL